MDCLTKLSRHEEALEAAQKAASFFPDSSDVNLELAFALENVKRIAEAVEASRRAVHLNPESARCFRQHARIANRAGDPREARAAAEQARLLDPENAFTWFLEGRIACSEYDYAEAIRRFEQAISRSPESAEFHHHLGLALQYVGWWSEAADRHREALRLNPRRQSAAQDLLDALVIPLAQEGRQKEAKKTVDEYIDFYRSMPFSSVAEMSTQVNKALSYAHLSPAGLGYLEEALALVTERAARDREEAGNGPFHQLSLAETLSAQALCLGRLGSVVKCHAHIRSDARATAAS
ncbi:hypothetical protein ACFQ71_41365 [Streptomyces sp. NPDC056534]|uniref:tetratricopeptide repeat protein n=1 Tax=Streptomyces sp. NPDC056534 TaxID=3345857 RepID=UPI0036B48950